MPISTYVMIVGLVVLGLGTLYFVLKNIALVVDSNILRFLNIQLFVADKMQVRISNLKSRRAQLTAEGSSTEDRYKESKLQKEKSARQANWMRQMLMMLNIDPREKAKELTDRLNKAGIRDKDKVVIYTFLSTFTPFIAFGVTIVLFLTGVLMPGKSITTKLFMLIMISYFVHKIPDIMLDSKVKERTKKIMRSLPDGIDLLVTCAESGLTADAAFSRVAKEIALAHPELANEFELTSIELGFSQDRKTAYRNLAQRVDLKAMRNLTTVLLQTEKYGTALAPSLRLLSSEFRNERMMLAEEKAARLPAIMTIPLILFIMPTLFVVIIGPAGCSIADNFSDSG